MENMFCRPSEKRVKPNEEAYRRAPKIEWMRMGRRLRKSHLLDRSEALSRTVDGRKR